MIKILELADLHVSPKWIDESEEDIKKICEIAKSENVDAICIAGDFFDKEIRSSDNDKYDRILQLARNLQAVAKCYFITGTPSHDAPGAYSALKDIGFKELNIGKSHVVGGTLIMGLPEINTAFIHANFPDLNKQEGIEKQYELVNQIIDDYYAPLAISHKGSVHFMMHGHISGAKFKDDQKPRTTEFMWDESMLARLKADRIHAGHIHYPQKYYTGSPHLTWGDTGFIPGFNVTTYGDNDISTERFYFNKPQRQKIKISDINKISESLDKIIPQSNLWIEILCDKEFHDQFDCTGTLADLTEKYNLSPLSKITTTIQHEEHTRIDLEEYEKVSSLEDLALIYNPDFSKSIIKKINIAEQATASETQSIIPRTFEFLDMELIGSIINFENGIDRIFVDYEHFKLGANLFIGANGKGKSFINGLIHPFSEHLPDGSNLKDLFVAKNSSMIRRFRIVETNEIITQKILIDPTLASPTAKFYMDINGQNIGAENGNVKPFDEKVSEIFGSVKMFMATVLKAQKENIKMPSLENAKESDLRQIFTELSGIDRTPVKNFANLEVKKLKSSIALDAREVEVLESVSESAKEISTAIADSEHSVTDKELSLSDNKATLENKKIELSGYEKIVNENQSIDFQISGISAEAQNLTADNGSLEYELRNISADLENIDGTRLGLEKLRTVQENHNDASRAYFEAQGAYNKKVVEWGNKKAVIDENLEAIKTEADKIKFLIDESRHGLAENEGFINVKKSVIESANDPCEHCGKISSSAQKKIDMMLSEIDSCNVKMRDYKKRIDDSEIILDEERLKYKALKDSISTQPEHPGSLIDLKIKMDSLKPNPSKISELETIITGLKSSEARKTELETQINQKNNRISEISKQIEKLKSKIKPVDKISYETLKIDISDIEQAISDNSGEIGRLTAGIEALHQRLQKNIEREEKIKLLTASLVKQQKDLTEWEIVEATFNAKGIPAMELSLLAPAINQKANEFLSMHSNRFNVDIITQDLNSTGKDIIEKFKIMIHDSKAADMKNLPNCSPGQLSWLTSALQEAVSFVRSKRSGRTYLWSIIDEGDGALDTEAMSDYYEMMDRAMDNRRKLISVSHSPIAKGIGLNTVNVEDFFMGGE
jgi:DNA repair exonuclease SbcCD ATPase subunit/DNA repair exonuclease SbcCD nuclease subunit